MAQKVRDVIKTTNCVTPCCIYACSKFNCDQVAAIRRVKDEEVYICGAAPLCEKCSHSEFFWSKCEKIRTRKTPNTETFHAVTTS